MISPFELLHLRKSIGASLGRMAELLGLDGAGAADTVRKMESGTKPLTGPIQRLAAYMKTGIAEPTVAPFLPEFLIGSDLTDRVDAEWILHTRYPRFLALVTEQPIVDVECVSVDEVEWLAVAVWIDEPVADPDALLLQAAEAFVAYSNRAALEELDRDDP